MKKKVYLLLFVILVLGVLLFSIATVIQDRTGQVFSAVSCISSSIGMFFTYSSGD